MKLTCHNLVGRSVSFMLVVFLVLNTFWLIVPVAGDDVPQEIRLYLGSDEGVVKDFEISEEQDSFKIVFYKITKNGKPTNEYIIWYEGKGRKAVVGGVNWHTLSHDIETFRVILSYIISDDILNFFKNLNNRSKNFRDDMKKVEEKSYDMMKNLEKTEKIAGIIAAVVAGIIVTVLTAGAGLPLVIGIGATLVKAAWSFYKLKDMTVEWDINPVKYPAYYLTVSMLSTFTDPNKGGFSIDDSADELNTILQKVTQKSRVQSDKLQEYLKYLVEYHKAALTVYGVGIEVGKDFGEGVAINYLARLVGTSSLISLYSIKGLIGNDKFVRIFGKEFLDSAEEFVYERLLGGQSELGVNQDDFRNAVHKIGKWFAAKFRPYAKSGISLDDIDEGMQSFKEIFGKVFSKEYLLKQLKLSMVSIAAEIAASWGTEQAVKLWQGNKRELATNGYIHADVSLELLDALTGLSKTVEEKPATRNHGSVVLGYLYITLVRENYEELLNITAGLFEKNNGLLKDDEVKGWLQTLCSNLDVDNCFQKKFDDLYEMWGSTTKDYLYIEKRIYDLTDSYIKNMTRRLANALPKAKAQADIMLVLDKSGSMNQNFINRRKIDILKDAATSLLNLATITKGTTRVGIVSFSSSAYLESLLTNDYQKLISIVNGLEASGGTAMGDALQLAADVLKNETVKDRTKTIILLTDGRSNTGTDPRLVLQNVIMPLKIPIYTIGIGKGIQEYDPEILKEIADKTNGTFYEVDPKKGVDESTLKKIFLRIVLGHIVGGENVQQELVDISQGQTVEYNIDVTDGRPFTVLAQYSGSRVRVNLYTPSGSSLTPSIENLLISQEGLEAWIVSSPEPGFWKVELYGEDVPTLSLPVLFSVNKATLASDITELLVEMIDLKPIEKTIKLKSASPSSPLRNVKVSLFGDIAKIATVTPESVDYVPPGSHVDITLKFNPPPSSGYYDGFVIFNDGWFSLSIPIKFLYKRIVVSAFTDSQKYSAGENVKIYAVVGDTNGQKILDANVTLAINGMLKTALKDDGKDVDEFAGDGIYSASFVAPTRPSVITLLIVADKTGYTPASTQLSLFIESSQPTTITTSNTETTSIFSLVGTSSPVSLLSLLIISLLLVLALGLMAGYTYSHRRVVCPFCGFRNRHGARFCRRCGGRMV